MDRGEEVPSKQRKQPVKAGSEGATGRVRCALNDLYNLERLTIARTGRCDYYQANTVRVGVWCNKCEVGMHRECYYTYHQLRYGVYLDNRYEIKKCRKQQGMRKLMSTKEANFQWTTVQPDIHSSDEEVRSHGSQDGRPSGSWAGSEEHSESKGDEEEDENKV